MTAAELIQVLMKDENVDKDVLVVECKPANAGRDWRQHELAIEDVKDFGATLQLAVSLPEQDCDHEDCVCDCDLCRHCLEQ